MVLALAKSRFNWRGERPAVLDHFFGRGHVPQALTNCWAICNTCNFYKTDNRPSARQWFDWFIAHAIVYEYEAEIERARARLNGMLEVRDRAAAASTTSPAREHVLPTRD